MKTVWAQAHMGSNPILSEKKKPLTRLFLFGEIEHGIRKGAEVNDSPVGCQSRSVTEPQRDRWPKGPDEAEERPLISLPFVLTASPQGEADKEGDFHAFFI